MYQMLCRGHCRGLLLGDRPGAGVHHHAGSVVPGGIAAERARLIEERLPAAIKSLRPR